TCFKFGAFKNNRMSQLFCSFHALESKGLLHFSLNQQQVGGNRGVPTSYMANHSVLRISSCKANSGSLQAPIHLHHR
ncbi:hypothetical protein Prudu_020825, partial [Prunus dulcis]